MRKGIPAVCLILFLARTIIGAGLWQPADSNYAGGKICPKIKVFDRDATDVNGPSIFLDCVSEERVSNPLSAFMYFVPLISPTLVDSKTSQKNSQLAGVIS